MKAASPLPRGSETGACLQYLDIWRGSSLWLWLVIVGLFSAFFTSEGDSIPSILTSEGDPAYGFGKWLCTYPQHFHF